jgi:dTDP-4-dehydrorhamnose reductase
MLIIGGGRQTGKALANQIDSSKIQATFVNRGITSQLGVEFYKNRNIHYIKSEREEFIDGNDLNFDVVLDTCSYEPIEYAKESKKWKKFSGKYILISSAYVYDYDSFLIDESSNLICEADIPKGISAENYDYGIKKIKCERIATENLSNLLILRPGILLSDYDHTSRLEKWIIRAQSGFNPSEEQKKWITQMTSIDHFASFIINCIDSEVKGIINIAGTPIYLEQFWNLILKVKDSIRIREKFPFSNDLEFFEKKIQAIINSKMGEKYGMIKTNSEHLLIDTLERKCKKY